MKAEATQEKSQRLMCMASSFRYACKASLNESVISHLPATDLGAKRVEVAALDVAEQHLNRRESEVVRPKVEDRHVQLPHYALRGNSPVVVGIVQHDHRVLAPAPVNRIQMLHQLHKEEAEGLAVGDASVHGVPDLSPARDRRYEIDRLEVRAAGHLIVPQLGHPAALAMVSQLENRLIDVDEAEPPLKSLDVPGGGVLALQDSRRHVLDLSDRPHKAIGGVHPLAQEAGEQAQADPQAGLPVQLAPDLFQKEGMLRVRKQVLQDGHRAVVELLELWASGRLPPEQVRVGLAFYS